jgi:hypothetical protein
MERLMHVYVFSANIRQSKRNYAMLAPVMGGSTVQSANGVLDLCQGSEQRFSMVLLHRRSFGQ